MASLLRRSVRFHHATHSVPQSTLSVGESALRDETKQRLQRRPDDGRTKNKPSEQIS